MRRVFSQRILLSVALSVLAMVLLLVVSLLVGNPIIRDAQARLVIRSVRVEDCVDSPTSWGVELADLSIYAYDPSGQPSNPRAPPIEQHLLQTALVYGTAHTSLTEDRTVAVVQVADSGPCAVVRQAGAAPDGGGLIAFIQVAGISTLAGILLALAGTYAFVILPFRTRVDELAAAASGVGQRSFHSPIERDDALGHIAGVLTTSHTRITETRKALEDRNTALEEHLSGVAHDLRTPLSSMQLALEAVAAESDGSLKEESRRALADVVYLSSLVENLHQGTRLRHDIEVTAGRVDLVELIERLERRFRIVGRHAGVKVAASVPDAAVWAGCTPALAERALANLVQNAIEHNDAPGHVAIRLTTDDSGDFELVVLDDGPGLPEPLRATLESESFLIDEARQRGPGLGMLITAEVTRRAGWNLSYEPLDPSGLRAVIRGPCRKPLG